MHTGRKRILLVLVLMVVAGVFVYIGLDCDAPIRKGEKSGIYRASLDDESVLIDFTDTTTLGLFSEFYTHDCFRQLTFDMDVTVTGGKVYVVVYDVTDTPYTQDTSKLTEVTRMEMEKNGSYNMDLKKLPENRGYAVGYFCDKDCMFTLDGSFSWQTSMKEYIHDAWLGHIFKWEEQYTPNCYPGNGWWDGEDE